MNHACQTKLAPEAGLEPATRRLIPTGRAYTIETQRLSNPFGGFHSLNLALAAHGGSSREVFLAPDQFPGTALTSELSHKSIAAIMGTKTVRQFISVPDVEIAV